MANVHRAKMPLSYYPIQVLLACFGIIIGLVLIILPELLGIGGGKPGIGALIIIAIPAIVLVRIHRAYVLYKIECQNPPDPFEEWSPADKDPGEETDGQEEE